MKQNELLSPVLAGAMATVLPVAVLGSESVGDLIAGIKSRDDKIRGPAWQGAAGAGALAVKPLADAMMDPDFEIARSAKRALYRIVRHAGRPGARKEAKAVTGELIQLLRSAHALVRREAAWMLSEIGADEAVKPLAALLSDPEAREDARCALMRFTSRKATSAFKTAFASAQEDFKPALAETLRARGIPVKGYASQKAVPSRKTTVGV
jgi:hypothetical protein